MKILSLAFLLLFVGCTSLHFRSHGHAPVVIGVENEHHIIKSHYGEVHYFLWGLIPNAHYISIDDDVKKLGFTSAANISVRNYQTFGNYFLTLLTLGMYVPMNYEINVYGRRGRNE